MNFGIHGPFSAAAGNRSSTHRSIRGNTNDALIRCVEACYDCAQACTACADACREAAGTITPTLQ